MSNCRFASCWLMLAANELQTSSSAGPSPVGPASTWTFVVVEIGPRRVLTVVRAVVLVGAALWMPVFVLAPTWAGLAAATPGASAVASAAAAASAVVMRAMRVV